MPPGLSEPRKELLGKLLRGGAASDAKEQGIVRLSDDAETPVSYGQQQIWLHSQVSAPTPIYNEMVTVHYLGELNRVAFERAFTEIIRRHEAWRTTFGWDGSQLVQRIQPPPERVEIPYLDYSNVPADSREETALQAAKAVALAPYDLAVGPMYRPRLVRFSAEEHRLFLGLHHIIFDGVSLYGVFLPELEILYDAFSEDRISPLKDLPLRYADYAVWHRRWVEDIAPKQLEYWQSKLESACDRDILPTDHPRAETPSYRGGTELLSLSSEVSLALKDLSRRSGATLFMILLATFHTLLWIYTGEEDLIIGCTSAGRNRTETDNLLGFFLNTIALRTDLSGDPIFLEVIHRGREALLSSLENDGVPFELIVEALCIRRSPNKHPFFQILFAFQPPLVPLKPSWKFSQMDFDLGVTKFDLHLELDERQDGIIGRFIYNSQLFDRTTIQGMLETWKIIVHKTVANPSLRLSQLVPVPELDQLRRVSREPVLKRETAPAESATRGLAGWVDSIRRYLRRGDFRRNEPD